MADDVQPTDFANQPQPGNGQPNGADTGPAIGLISQYVKDLSFENPSAPAVYQWTSQPSIDVQFNIGSNVVADNVHETAIKIDINARHPEGQAFVIDLTYAGLFGVRNVPEDQIQAFMLAEAPRILFPFARRIIAEPPSEPPPNVPALQEDTKGLTLRQRLEQHRSGQVCMQCHLKIDPWGVALEQYDANGLMKPKPADASSKLPDSTVVNNIDEFRKYLAEDRIDQVAFSVLKHLATYACGRSLTYNEVNYLKTEGKSLRASGYRMRDMIQFVAASPIFREK